MGVTAARIGLGILMALHGVAHFVGFAVPWGLAKPPGGTYSTTILGGRVDLGASGMRAYGVLWLLLGIGFLFAAIGTIAARGDWFHLALWVTVASLLLAILSWPEARIGVAVNLVILAWLHAGLWLGAF